MSRPGAGAADGAGGPAVVGFDPTVPNAARMYDYLLGGKDSFAVDRAAAGELLAHSPDVTAAVRDNRDFLGRAVEFAAGRGIRQFIDIGSGLPTARNTHEIARGAIGDPRVLYVDNDLVVLTHARALLEDDPGVAVMTGDLHEPDAILSGQRASGLIDLREPVAVLLVAVLHFSGDRAYDAVDCLKRAMPAGSCLVLSHASADNVPEHESKGAREIYDGASARLYPRSRGQIARFFSGLDLAEPGLVPAGEWRAPAGTARRALVYAGVGLK